MTTCDYFKSHQAKDKVLALNLRRLYCIPFKNFHSTSEGAVWAGLLNIYTEAQVILPPELIEVISSRLSDIYSTMFVIMKDRISDATLEIFGGGTLQENPKALLKTVLQDVCLALIKVEAGSIYEWDLHRLGYAIAATTGLVQETIIRDFASSTLIEHVAEHRRPIIVSDLLDAARVCVEIGESIDEEALKTNLEITKSVPKSCVICLCQILRGLRLLNPSRL